MPIYMSFSSSMRSSLSSGYSRIHGMSRGLTALTPSTLICAWEYATGSPYDAGTGQASGKRQHDPINIIKEADATSPLYGYVVKHEKLPRLKLHFTRLSPQGAKQAYFTLTLVNAALIGVQRAPHHQISSNTHELEELELAFEKIELSWNAGAKSMHDDWD
jgi:type VI secretion system secreted protein Hcp